MFKVTAVTSLFRTNEVCREYLSFHTHTKHTIIINRRHFQNVKLQIYSFVRIDKSSSVYQKHVQACDIYLRSILMMYAFNFKRHLKSFLGNDNDDVRYYIQSRIIIMIQRYASYVKDKDKCYVLLLHCI